jgi:hypothetical protein
MLTPTPDARLPQSPAPRTPPDRSAGVPRPRRASAHDAARRGRPYPYDTRRTERTAPTRPRTDQTAPRRFSEGIEQRPDAPEKRVTGRFSRGIEQRPGTPEKKVTRRFSHGIEQLPDTPEKRALGRFSRGIEQVERAR